MNSKEKKQFIVGVIIFVAILTMLQYIFSPASFDTPLKFVLYIIIATLIYAPLTYWLLVRKKKEQQSQIHSDDISQ